MFRVVRGTPTAEELAALVGALIPRTQPSTARPTESTWARIARPGTVSASGMPSRSGVDAWRISGLPR